MKVIDRVSLDQWFLMAVGAALFLLSVAGVFHGSRAAWASRLSYQAQLSRTPVEVGQILEWSQKAYSLYPWNYYLAIFAAEKAYYQSDSLTGEARAERLRQAKLWCERGLLLNPYKSQLRRLKTRFLWEESPAEAIAYWKAYTDWQFWEPYNHATLAEMYARFGDLDKADAELKWVEGDASYAQVRETVTRERKIWENLQSGKPVEWGE